MRERMWAFAMLVGVLGVLYVLGRYLGVIRFDVPVVVSLALL